MKNFIPKQTDKPTISEILAGCRTQKDVQIYRLKDKARFGKTAEERLMAERDLEEIYEQRNLCV